MISNRHSWYDVTLTSHCLSVSSTAFTISIPCTGKKTGIASMYLSLAIAHSNGYAIDGSPLKLLIRKRCIAFGERRR